MLNMDIKMYRLGKQKQKEITRIPEVEKKPGANRYVTTHVVFDGNLSHYEIRHFTIP